MHLPNIFRQIALPLVKPQIRAAYVNCTKGEAKRACPSRATWPTGAYAAPG
jgi:hypothetical protein